MDYDNMLDEINSKRPVDFKPDVHMYKALWSDDNEFIKLLSSDGVEYDKLSLDIIKGITVNEGFYWHTVDEYFLSEDDLIEFLKSKAETDPDFLVSFATGQFDSVEKIAVLEIEGEYHTTRETVDSVQSKLNTFIGDATELQEQVKKWVEGPDSEYINRTQFSNYISDSSKSIKEAITKKCDDRIYAELNKQGLAPTTDNWAATRRSDPKFTEDGIKTDLINHARNKEKIIDQAKALDSKVGEVDSENEKPVMKM